MQPFIFIHINKTGGSSLEKALGLPFQHLTVKEVIARWGIETWNHAFTFTVIRNPWDKVVSHYHYRLAVDRDSLGKPPLNFTDWVKRAYGDNDHRYYNSPMMFMPQVAWIRDNTGSISLDYIARYESIETDFTKICQLLNRTATPPHIKRSDRGDYQQYYDTHSTEIISRWFSDDIQQFSYSFE